MAKTFTADPIVLDSKGKALLDEAISFKKEVDRVYECVHEMANSSYLSPESMALANKIDTFRDDLVSMGNLIDNYGKFCISSSRKVMRNQDEIISEI